MIKDFPTPVETKDDGPTLFTYRIMFADGQVMDIAETYMVVTATFLALCNNGNMLFTAPWSSVTAAYQLGL